MEPHRQRLRNHTILLFTTFTIPAPLLRPLTIVNTASTGYVYFLVYQGLPDPIPLSFGVSSLAALASVGSTCVVVTRWPPILLR
jgi:hypothetical protein